MNNYIEADEVDNILDLHLNVLVFEQGDYYVAFCPSLNLSSYGDTIDAAKTGFDEVMTSYLEDSRDNNFLHEDLLKNGWTFNIQDRKKAEPPAMVELNITAGLLRSQYNENWRVKMY